MAGTQPILNCPSTVSAAGGIVVVGDTSSATPSTPSSIGSLVGTTSTGVVSGLPALLIVFV